MSVTIDAVEINSLVARRPEKLLAVLERETLNGLWQLVLTDPERHMEWLLGRPMEWRLCLPAACATLSIRSDTTAASARCTVSATAPIADAISSITTSAMAAMPAAVTTEIRSPKADILFA